MLWPKRTMANLFRSLLGRKIDQLFHPPLLPNYRTDPSVDISSDLYRHLQKTQTPYKEAKSLLPTPKCALKLCYCTEIIVNSILSNKKKTLHLRQKRAFLQIRFMVSCIFKFLQPKVNFCIPTSCF